MTHDLDYYLWQLRRITEHRELGAEQHIRRIYNEILDDLQSFIANEYIRFDTDELTYAVLQAKGEKARFLMEVQERLDGISPRVKAEIQRAIEEVYRINYAGMVDAVSQALTRSELHAAFQSVKTVLPETIRAAVQNPIKKLTLDKVLERNRKLIIHEIKKEIGIGLAQGDRMTTMARRIQGSLQGDYTKAIRIVRTEVHRVREAGTLDAARGLQDELTNAGVVFTKTWVTMDDERVRPKRGIGHKAVKNPKANHVKMHGKTVLMDEDFDLGRGVKAAAPGQSGDAANDINCRCFVSYDLEIVETQQTTFL